MRRRGSLIYLPTSSTFLIVASSYTVLYEALSQERQLGRPDPGIHDGIIPA